MNVPANLKYSNDHEWCRVEGGEAFIGITDFCLLYTSTRNHPQKSDRLPLTLGPQEERKGILLIGIERRDMPVSYTHLPLPTG